MQIIDILVKVAWGVGLLLVGVVAFLLIAVAWRRITAAPPVPWPEGTYVLPTRTWQARWVGQLYYMSSEKFEDGTPAETGDHHVRWMAEARAAGKRFVGYELFAGNRIVLPVHPADMEHLLVHAQAGLNKHEGYKGLEFILGSKSLITLRDLAIHRRLRALVAPVFRKQSISDIATFVMTKHMSGFVESIQKSIASNAMPGGGGGIVDVARQSQLFSLRTITEAGFKRLDINGTAVDETFLRATNTLNFSWTDIFPPAIRRNQWIFPTQRNRSSAETARIYSRQQKVDHVRFSVCGFP